MKKFLFFFLITLNLSLSINVLTFASTNNLANLGVPYQTYTLGASNRIIPTQTAYLPVGIFGKDLNLNAPQDIFYDGAIFYLADTGNKRVVALDINQTIINTYEIDEFITPSGVFVDKGYLYVADKGAKAVFKINLTTKQVELKVTKPSSPIFGQKNDFLPIKVAVGSDESIYIIGEGSTSGVIQVNYLGEFIGYLGINTVSLSFQKILYNFFVKNSDLASSLPASPTNIALAEKGAILTTNVNVDETFKRLNIAGENTLLPSTFYPKTSLSDLWMSNNYLYLVSSSGEVYEYDYTGNLLFHFNTKDIMMNQTLGLTSNPSGIVTDNLGNLYILDKGYQNIQIYQKTVFVDLVHQAVALYNDGKYLESKPIWEEILRQNTSFALAHQALGQALIKEGSYRDALTSFKEALDYNGYSLAYWEIRNEFIQKHLTIGVLIIIGMIILFKVLKYVYKKSFDLIVKEEVEKRKLAKELTLSFKLLKKPSDAFYLIKRKNGASYLSGTIILGLFLLVYLINTYFSGFLFRQTNLQHVFLPLVIILGLFLLFVIVNYFISSLSDGEGRFKDVYLASCYALMPYLLFTLPMTFISNFLTFNESFIYSFYHQIIISWTIILLIYSIQAIHNYRFWELVRNLLLIIFGMMIVIIIGMLVYTFINQLIEFILSILREVWYRVKS